MKFARMSNEKRKKLASTNSLLPSINYKKSISLVLLLLVTFTSPSIQTPLSHYDCPSGCECDETQLSAKCDNIDALIESYSLKGHHHTMKKNFMPIKSLDLSNNRLTKISNQLELLVNLTELNLSHNHLTQVHKLNFNHLETLDLSFNKITSGKLSKLPKNVVHLKLSHNQITYLPSDFMKLKKLRSLELTENPLNCSCDTLMIRNWIAYQNVWSDKIIKCASPQIFKGLPWLQARQNDICIETTSTTQRSKYNWDEQDYDNNDIMMGDQPQEDEDEEHGGGVEGTAEAPKGSEDDLEDDNTTKEENYDEEKDEDVDVFASQSPPTHEETIQDDVNYDDEKDEIENDFIPISTVKTPTHSSNEVPKSEEKEEEEENEGSGSEKFIKVEEKEDEEESGSGGLFILGDSSPTLGIFQDDSTTTTTEAEATLPIGIQKNPVVSDETLSSGADPDALNKANVTEDNTGTYILLVIIGALLISLIIFVAMKNRQEKRNNKRRYDVEKNGATELQDMDKSLLGKPIDRNGNRKHEHSPLISDNHKKDDGFMPYTTPAITVDEPIQEVPQKEKEKSQQSLHENGLPNGNGNVFEPIEPVHNTNGSVPKSPDSDEEVFHPANDNLNGPDSLEAPVDTPKRYSPIYTPISPRSARYSPVYSPETGRVKIKLTETPKPKTPVVVTRSRSRAGDYVNSPNN